MTSKFSLSSVLPGHTQDIKALVAIDSNRFCSASRDTKVIIWTRVNDKFIETGMFSKHNHFVNCLAYLQPTNAQPNGLVVSAGNDKIIYTFDPMQPKDYVYKLEGHTDNICTLAISPSGEIISGSWDKTARVWKDGKCVAILKGHEFAVWGVLAIGNDVITASADKTIRVWRQGKEVSRLVGHEDVVRSLVEIPSLGFASCSNDASIRMWTLNGDCIRECYGHTSFVYSLAVLPTGEIVSSGEDRTVRVWQGSDQVQAIAQPCISVWAVAALPNGDIVAGGSDGIIRIFTRSEERIASKTEIEVFEAAIASSSIPSNQVGDLDKSKVAGVEALSVPGMKEGEVKMVKNSGMVEAYQWSHAQHQWVKIGEVVDAVGNSRKQVFGGQEYDYVFDVDIQEGAPPLKLPYNKGDNPYQAAQDFIHANEIPQDYLEQIADFIVKNVGDVTLGAMPSSQHVDPFTGAGRYVPGGTQPAPKPSPAISSSLIPMKQFAFIKAANTDAIINKIVQFNTELSKNASLGLNAAELNRLHGIVANLKNGTIGKVFTIEDWEVLSKMMNQWPESNKFPAIDLLRLVVLHSSAPIAFQSDLLESMLGMLECDMNNKAQETISMLIIRVYCNAFAQKEYLKSILSIKTRLLTKITQFTAYGHNKNLQTALANLLLNLAVFYNQGTKDEFGTSLLETTISLAKTSTDPDVFLRTVVIIGTLLSENRHLKSVPFDKSLLQRQGSGELQNACAVVRSLLN